MFRDFLILFIIYKICNYLSILFLLIAIHKEFLKVDISVYIQSTIITNNYYYYYYLFFIFIISIIISFIIIIIKLLTNIIEVALNSSCECRCVATLSTYTGVEEFALEIWRMDTSILILCHKKITRRSFHQLTINCKFHADRIIYFLILILFL